MDYEILFRGRTLIRNEWVVGDLSSAVQNDDRCYVFPADGYDSPDFYEVDPDTVGLFTGLTDKNGVKIFVGDIVKADESADYAIGVVEFGAYGLLRGEEKTHIGFSIRWRDRKHQLGVRRDLGYWNQIGEVIGNIHDNPELMEESEEE